MLLVPGFLFLGVPVRAENAAALLAEADRLAWLKNWIRAAPLFARAEQLYYENGDNRNALHAKISRLRAQVDALSYPQVSAYLGRLLEMPVVQADPRLKLRCLVAKGEIDILLESSAASKPIWEQVRSLARTIGDKGWEARSDGELGIIAFLDGDSVSALRLVGRALNAARASGDVGAQVRYMSLIGRALEQFGRSEAALGYFDRAIALAEHTEDAPFPHIAYVGRGESLMTLRRFGEARKALESALDEAKKSGLPGYEADVLIIFGRLHAASGNRRLAIEYLERAAAVAMQAELNRLVAPAMSELARLYREGGDIEKAQECAAIAAQAGRKIGEVYTQPQELAIQADLKVAQGEFREADRLYSRAIDIIDGMLVNAPSPEARASLIAAMSEIYVKHFSFAVKHLHDKEKAFRILEQARGRSAADVLRARPFEDSGEPVKRTEADAKIARLQMQLIRSEDPGERRKVLEKIFEAEQELALKRTPVSLHENPIELSQLQQSLRKDEVLLEYVLSAPQSFCLAITCDRVGVVFLADRRRIERAAEEYLGEVRLRKTDRELARLLYDLLLRPVPQQFRRLRLVVAPDAVLHRLAFDSLLGPDGLYVLHSHVLTTVPSGAVLYLLRTSPSNAKPDLPLLAVGNVHYSAAGTGENSSVVRDQTRGIYDLKGAEFSSLPSTLKEVNEVARLIGRKSVVLLGDSATETAFKSQPLSKFSILHLAVHGVSSSVFPDRAALVFAAARSGDDDGLLQAREISRLHLSADLVTLSACNTGIGRLEGQGGVANLVRAFLFAGARSVVASQWPADDVFTAALMKRFYSRLAEGLDKGSALRQAKLDLLRRNREGVAPYYWAGFTLVGEGATPLRFPR